MALKVVAEYLDLHYFERVLFSKPSEYRVVLRFGKSGKAGKFFRVARTVVKNRAIPGLVVVIDRKLLETANGNLGDARSGIVHVLIRGLSEACAIITSGNLHTVEDRTGSDPKRAKKPKRFFQEVDRRGGGAALDAEEHEKALLRLSSSKTETDEELENMTLEVAESQGRDARFCINPRLANRLTVTDGISVTLDTAYAVELRRKVRGVDHKGIAFTLVRSICGGVVNAIEMPKTCGGDGPYQFRAADLALKKMPSMTKGKGNGKSRVENRNAGCVALIGGRVKSPS